MKTSVTIIFIFLLQTTLAQQFQGIATYQSSQQITIEHDSTGVSQREMSDLQQQLRKQLEKEYILRFNRNESVYKVVEELKLDDPKAANSRLIVVSSGGDYKLYRDISQKIYIKEEDLMGKKFLIKDELKSPEWKIESEKKKIGHYTCNKATWTREEELTKFDPVNGTTREKVVKTTIAWYTPEIPVGHGPSRYWGLPGLILEIQEDKFSLLCTSIILNPSEKFELEIPNKGKEINQVAFDKIRTEKTKEMMEEFEKGREKGSLRIRG